MINCFSRDSYFDVHFRIHIEKFHFRLAQTLYRQNPFSFIPIVTGIKKKGNRSSTLLVFSHRNRPTIPFLSGSVASCPVSSGFQILLHGVFELQPLRRERIDWLRAPGRASRRAVWNWVGQRRHWQRAHLRASARPLSRMAEAQWR
ncbi:MAG: hypothetical protein ACKOEO_16460 [Planctomycetaceae bacterium]